MTELKIILQELITRKILIKEGDSLWIKEEELLFIDDNENVSPDSGKEYEKDLELFNLLRDVRTKASQKFVQSAYLICPDDVLREVAHQKPKNKSGLLSIKGFNNRMFNKVGEDFLEIIKSVPEQNDKETAELPSNLKETYLLLKKGLDLGAIASMRKLSEEIISMQIETIIEYEPGIEIQKLFGKVNYENILREINNGVTNLKLLKAKLNNEVPFPFLRIAVAKYKSTSASSFSKYQRVQSP